jgi:hypothetical protein
MKPELLSVEAQYLALLTTEDIRILADLLVKNYPEVADKLETALGNSFFDNNTVV